MKSKNVKNFVSKNENNLHSKHLLPGVWMTTKTRSCTLAFPVSFSSLKGCLNILLPSHAHSISGLQTMARLSSKDPCDFSLINSPSSNSASLSVVNRLPMQRNTTKQLKSARSDWNREPTNLVENNVLTRMSWPNGNNYCVWVACYKCINLFSFFFLPSAKTLIDKNFISSERM